MKKLEVVKTKIEGGDFSEEALTQLEVQVKYSGYIAKEKNNADKISRLARQNSRGFLLRQLKVAVL